MRRRIGHDRHLQFAGRDLVGQRLGRTFHDLQDDVGRGAMKSCDEVVQQQQARARHHADVQDAARERNAGR